MDLHGLCGLAGCCSQLLDLAVLGHEKHTRSRASPFDLFRASLPQFRRFPFSLHSAYGT
jgi:hypothetical protein